MRYSSIFEREFMCVGYTVKNHDFWSIYTPKMDFSLFAEVANSHRTALSGLILFLCWPD